MKLLLLVPSLLLFAIAQLTFHPDMLLVFWLSAAMVVDLVTGVVKSIVLQRPRTSTGFQRTATKFLRYFGSIFVAFLLQNILPDKVITIPFIDGTIPVSDLTKYMIFYLIYIEVLSILENIIAMDTNDKLSNGPLVWIHNFLSLKFKEMGKKQKTDNGAGQ